MTCRILILVLAIASAGIPVMAAGLEASEWPVAFEPNQGQFHPDVQFMARAPGQQIFLTADGARIRTRGASIGLRFAGAEPATAGLEGVQPLTGRSHYFHGAGPAAWTKNVPTFERVRASGVYPGIDVAYYGNRGRLEYDFVVAAGSEPSAIRLHFDGVDQVRVDANGDLLLSAGGHPFRQLRPVAYQRIAGERVAVAADYQVSDAGVVGFTLGAYDRRSELIIDPVVEFSTFLGGAGLEEGWAVATDKQGSIYVAGVTESPDFPVTFGAYEIGYRSDELPGDAFVTKLSPDGKTVIYSTFLGGAATDVARAIAVNGLGEVIVAGETESFNFPVSLGAFQIFQASIGVFADGFVTKLSADGSSMIYSTYLGDDFIDRIYGLALDTAGNAVVAGASDSARFPTTPNAYLTFCPGRNFGGFVAKLAGDGGSLAWSTRLCGSAADEALAVSVDGQNNVLVGGVTLSPDFPATLGALQTSGADGQEDGFVAKLNSDGSNLMYSTFLGGSAPDAVHGVSVDGSGIAYAVGRTLSEDFPATGGSFQSGHADRGGFDDGFAAAIGRDGDALVYSTFLGGSGSDQAHAVYVDPGGGLFVTGFTEAADFPISPVMCQPGFNGGRDVFALKLAPGGAASEFGMLLGGREDDIGLGVAMGADGSAVVVGQTASSNFTTTPEAFRSAYASGYRGSSDAFVARIGAGAGPAAPCISLNGFVNGASFLPGPLAPGEIVSFFGAGLGPEAPVVFDLNGGDRIATELAGTQIFFDGAPGPVIATSSGQVNAIVPYAVAGRDSVVVSIVYHGTATAPLTIPVRTAAPALFTQNSSGQGAGAILNQDFSLNQPSNPAAKGAIVQVFATGEGQTAPGGEDGKLATDSLPRPVLPVRVIIGGLEAPVHYAGAAPGLVAGLIQINAEVPRDVAGGSAIPIQILVGEESSPPGVTLAIQ